MTIMSTISLRRCAAVSLLLLAACRQTDVLGPAVITRQPVDSTATPQPAAPPSGGPDTITVLVLPYENGCTPTSALCIPARVTSLTVDGGAPRTFSTPGPVEFSGLGPGRHVLRNISGIYGGPVICGFWFEDGSQEITVVLEEGKAITVPLHFECY